VVGLSHPKEKKKADYPGGLFSLVFHPVFLAAF
jgi:hypothetical protein